MSRGNIAIYTYAMTAPALAQHQKRAAAFTLVAELLGVLAQLALVYNGIRYIFVDDGEAAETVRLLIWCVVATVYLGLTVLWLNIDLRLNSDDHALLRRVSSITLIRWFSTLVTFTSSLVGLAAATTIILKRNDPDHLNATDAIAVWAMLASWALFHWGYSRIYYSSYHRREAERPLRFPATKHPRLTDFVYFAFTNGTSFAPSDVSVATSRMRWTVVWHTTMSFFFNALIIVLTMNTIAGGFLD